MKSNPLTNSLNVSNQANLANCRRTNLWQYNLVVILGGGWLTRNRLQVREEGLIPISVRVNEDGEVSITGLDMASLQDENKIKVYADKKVVTSGEKAEANE
ncbi:MAG: hypothetical protein GXY91_00580 [Clostridia bacterium]|nr:hypothetical protein [Clostridia bacterium]